MESMNISLPEPLKAFVDSQISTGRYSSVSEYVRELIRADEKRKAEEQLESLLLAGLKGEETVMSRADWQQIRQEATAHEYFSPSWTPFQADRGRCFSVIVDDGGGAQVIF